MDLVILAPNVKSLVTILSAHVRQNTLGLLPQDASQVSGYCFMIRVASLSQGCSRLLLWGSLFGIKACSRGISHPPHTFRSQYPTKEEEHLDEFPYLIFSPSCSCFSVFYIFLSNIFHFPFKTYRKKV